MSDNPELDLSKERRGIRFAIAFGIAVALALILMGPVLKLLPVMADDISERLEVTALLVAGLGLWLIFTIARLAWHRFFSDQDLNPLAGSPTPTAMALQNQLQNTLEQCVLGTIAYVSFAILAPSEWGPIPVLGFALFSIGRTLFITGYSRGASARALGFVLTFYPSVAILLMAMAGYFWN